MTVGIYAYNDLYNDEIIYVGKSEVSIENRHKQHLNGDQVIDNIIRSNPKRYELIILKECEAEQCDEYEAMFIEEYETFRYKHGKGFNFTAGGDGGKRKPDLGQNDLHGVDLILRKFGDSPYYFRMKYYTASYKLKTLKAKTLDELKAKAEKNKLVIFSYSDLAERFPYDKIHLGTPKVGTNPIEDSPFPMVTEHIYAIQKLPYDEGEEYVYDLACSIYGDRFLKEVKLICEVTGFENNPHIKSKIEEREFWVDTNFYKSAVYNIERYHNGGYTCCRETYENQVKFIEEYEEKYKDRL